MSKLARNPLVANLLIVLAGAALAYALGLLLYLSAALVTLGQGQRLNFAYPLPQPSLVLVGPYLLAGLFALRARRLNRLAQRRFTPRSLRRPPANATQLGHRALSVGALVTGSLAVYMLVAPGAPLRIAGYGDLSAPVTFALQVAACVSATAFAEASLRRLLEEAPPAT